MSAEDTKELSPPEEHVESPAVRISREQRKKLEAVQKWEPPEVGRVSKSTLEAALNQTTDRDDRGVFASVREAADNAFRTGPGWEWGKHVESMAWVNRRTDEVKQYRADLAKQIDGQPKRVVLNEDATPYSLTAWVTIVSCSAMLLGLLYVCWNVMTAAVVQSGIFEDESTARAFSVVPLGVPLLLKGISERFSAAGKNRYFAVLGGVTIFLAILWFWLFAATFGHGISTTLPKLGEEVDTTDYTTPLLACSMIVECLLAAGLWLIICHVDYSHRKTGRNEDHAELQAEDLLAQETLEFLEGDVGPDLKAINDWYKNAHKKFVKDAENDFEILAGRRARTRETIDFLHSERFQNLPTRLNGDSS